MAEITALPLATSVDDTDLLPLYDGDTGKPQRLTGSLLYKEYGDRVAAAAEAAGLPDTGLLALYDAQGNLQYLTGARLKEILSTEGIDADSGVTRAQAEALIASWARAGQTEPLGLDALSNPALDDVARYDGTNWVSGKIGSGAIAQRGLDESNRFADGVIVLNALSQEIKDRLPNTRAAGDAAKYLNEQGDFTTPAGQGGGGGLTQTQVDARVKAGVEDWAETDNTDVIPPVKLENFKEVSALPSSRQFR